MEIKTSLQKQTNTNTNTETSFADVYSKTINITMNTKNDMTEINIILTTIIDSVRRTIENDSEFDDYWFDFLVALHDNLKSKETPGLNDIYNNLYKLKRGEK